MGRVLANLDVLGILSAPEITLDGQDLETRLAALEAGGGGGEGLGLGPRAFRHYRFYITETGDNTGAIARDLRLQAEPGGANLTQTEGGTASANAITIYTSATWAWAGTNNWHSDVMPAWIAWDFGEGNEQVVRAYTIAHDEGIAECWRDWVLQGSDDGVTWYDLDTVTDYVWPTNTGSYNPVEFEIESVHPPLEGDVLTHDGISWIPGVPAPTPYLELAGGTVTGDLRLEGNVEIAAGVPSIRFSDTNVSGLGANWWLHVNNGHFFILRDDTGDGSYNTPYPLQIDTGGRILVYGNEVWHAGNDGSGSGLDADTVDGQHASAFHYGSVLSGIATIQIQSSDRDIELSDGATSFFGHTSGNTINFNGDNTNYNSHIKLGSLDVVNNLRVRGTFVLPVV